jgi:hypothetical protein
LCQSKIIFFLTGCKTRPGVEVVIRSLLVAKMSDVSCDDHNDLHFEIACISRTICFFFCDKGRIAFRVWREYKFSVSSLINMYGLPFPTGSLAQPELYCILRVVTREWIDEALVDQHL